MKALLNSKNSRVLGLICIMALATMSSPAQAGFVGDAMKTTQAADIVRIVFGLMGAGIIGKIIWDFLDSQTISNGLAKLIGVGICIGAVMKPTLITNLLANL